MYSRLEAASIASWVFEDVLNLRKHEMILSQNQAIAKEDRKRLHETLERLLHHEPLQYILGYTYFYDMKLKVDANVLIPRPETEELVRWVIEDTIKSNPPKPLKIIDIGTGSGCIAIALKKALTNVEVIAIDVSAGALQTASENALSQDVAITFLQIDVLNPTQCGTLPQCDIIVSNPPYVTFAEKQQMGENVKRYEPSSALFVENATPVIFYETIAALGQQKLYNDGSLYFEINPLYQAQIVDTLHSNGYHQIDRRDDLQQKCRMISGKKKEIG